MKHFEVIVIGSGPSGLAVSALLKREKIENLILEKDETFGGSYAKINPERKLLSPKAFNSLPLQEGKWNNEIITSKEYLDYLIDYKEKQNITIEYKQNVSKILFENNIFKLEVNNKISYTCNKLVLATGMYSFPNQGIFQQTENPKLEYQEAIDFKGLSYYKDKKVLIIGSGTSAVEIAGLIAYTSKVYMSIKGDFKTIPLNVLGKNIHYFIKYFEKIPVKYLKNHCNAHWAHPGLDDGFTKAIKANKIQLIRNKIAIQDNELKVESNSYPIDIVINCIGYKFGTPILPEGIKLRPNGLIETIDNQSISNKKLFVMGQPCAGRVASAFLRGIREDSYNILGLVKKGN